MAETPAAPPLRGHLDQVDVFRVLTFLAVVGVHATAFGNPASSTGAGAAGMLLHFTREAFFFLTGFVLVHSQGSRPVRPLPFWRKRFRLIGVPYLTWTAIYAAYNQLTAGGPASALPHTLLVDVLAGNAFYHLYFLVVSMQAYLLFPALVWLLDRTARHPWALLGVAAIVQLAEDQWLFRGTPPPTGLLHFYGHWYYVLFPTYLLYLVAGAVVARNLAAAQGWLMRHRGALVVAGAASALLAEAVFAHSVHEGHSPAAGAHDASAVFQPVMVVWSLGCVAVLAALGCSFSASRWHGDPRARRALTWASSASFGVYLVHPLVLAQLLRLDLGARLPQPWATLLLWAATVVVAGAVVGVLRLTPLSLPLTGRPRPRRVDAPVTPSIAPENTPTSSTTPTQKPPPALAATHA